MTSVLELFYIMIEYRYTNPPRDEYEVGIGDSAMKAIYERPIREIQRLVKCKHVKRHHGRKREFIALKRHVKIQMKVQIFRAVKTIQEWARYILYRPGKGLLYKKSKQSYETTLLKNQIN